MRPNIGYLDSHVVHFLTTRVVIFESQIFNKDGEKFYLHQSFSEGLDLVDSHGSSILPGLVNKQKAIEDGP